MSQDKDPYAFTNANEMGEVVKPAKTYARHALLDEQGNVVPVGDPDPVQLDVWRYVIDLNTKEQTSFVKRERMRTFGEVFKDLRQRLDVLLCDKCKHERTRREWNEDQGSDYGGDRCLACKEGEYESLIDEYFSGPEHSDENKPLPHSYRWVASYPVTGGSEGHYIHVELPERAERIKTADGQEIHLSSFDNVWRIHRIALGKTFRGMDHAAEIARRCAILLGA